MGDFAERIDRSLVSGKQLSVEQYPALSATAVVRHAFITRVPGIDVSHDKAEVLKRLDAAHREVRRSIDVADWPLLTVEQIHGDKITIIDRPVGSDEQIAGCDALITNQRRALLGIHVADCCAVYIVDPKTPAIGLVHSGKKGTELGIAAKAIERMTEKFGSVPANMIVELSPCIRPPHYEIDFAAEIIRQSRSKGISRVHDSGVCTACDIQRYYSYRAEKGKTGRMLALLGLL